MVTYNFTVKRGDTWDGVMFNVTVNNTAFNMANSAVLCQFKTNASVNAALTLATGNGITLLDGANGQFKLDAQVIDIPTGVYLYDVQITTVANTVKTYIGGRMTVEDDITR